jgi:hypothetical protein
MSSEQDIKDIVAQLQQLSIQQSELLQRLGRLTTSGRNTSNNTAGRPNATREFAIGDRVRIRNPRLSQATRGTITKIGPSRITVLATNGTKILQAPWNIILED